MEKIKSILKWTCIIVLLYFVQMCAGAVIKARTEAKIHKGDANSLVRGNEDFEINQDFNQSSEVGEKLSMIVRKLNQELPIQVDETTIMSRVEKRNNNEIRYYFTILNDDLVLSDDEVEQYRRILVQRARASNEINLFKKHRVIMSYGYYKRNGECIMLIKVTPNDYLR